MALPLSMHQASKQYKLLCRTSGCYWLSTLHPPPPPPSTPLCLSPPGQAQVVTAAVAKMRAQHSPSDPDAPLPSSNAATHNPGSSAHALFRCYSGPSRRLQDPVRDAALLPGQAMAATAGAGHDWRDVVGPLNIKALVAGPGAAEDGLGGAAGGGQGGSPAVRRLRFSAAGQDVTVAGPGGTAELSGSTSGGTADKGAAAPGRLSRTASPGDGEAEGTAALLMLRKLSLTEEGEEEEEEGNEGKEGAQGEAEGRHALLLGDCAAEGAATERGGARGRDEGMEATFRYHPPVPPDAADLSWAVGAATAGGSGRQQPLRGSAGRRYEAGGTGVEAGAGGEGGEALAAEAIVREVDQLRGHLSRLHR